MEPIKDFTQLTKMLRHLKQRKRVVVVCPNDAHTEYVIERSLNEGFANFLLVTDSAHLSISQALKEGYPENITVYNTPTIEDAAREAVWLVKNGVGDVLMKGLISTDILLKAVLDKEHGLLPHDKVLTHITAARIPTYNKMLFFSDAAVIPRPNYEQLDAMIKYDIKVCEKLGVEKPRIALIHCNEKISQKFPHTLAYAEILEKANRGEYGDVYIDGPMDVKTACCKYSGEIKGQSSPVVGNADILIFPNIESGNTFYKSIALFADADTAGMLRGAIAPVVIPSRADTGNSKYFSLVFACVAG